ncbi:hypothetical protein BDW75DRAFT_211958 [Aspergillus navahoensis]
MHQGSGSLGFGLISLASRTPGSQGQSYLGYAAVLIGLCRRAPRKSPTTCCCPRISTAWPVLPLKSVASPAHYFSRFRQCGAIRHSTGSRSGSLTRAIPQPPGRQEQPTSWG